MSDKPRLQREERCALCGCPVHRRGNYARPNVDGRSHATAHHYVPKRFFGRSKNRGGEQREPIWAACPWPGEGASAVFCYECHEEILHNPVLLPEDIRALADLVRQRGLDEDEKPFPRCNPKLAGRIELLHSVIQAGLRALASRTTDVKADR